MRTQIFNALKITALAITLSFGMSYALAWTAPTVAPTGGNVNTPINASGTAQSKAGSLGIGMTTTPPPATKLQVSNGNIQFDIPATSLANALITWPGGSPNFRLTDSLGVENINVNSQNGSYTYFNAGNVGIGTATPGQKLTVAGAIGATGDICTTTTGPSICLSTPAAAASPHGKQWFTANGTFSVPAGITKVYLTGSGSGGTGGSGALVSSWTAAASSGRGAGGYGTGSNGARGTGCFNGSNGGAGGTGPGYSPAGGGVGAAEGGASGGGGGLGQSVYNREVAVSSGQSYSVTLGAGLPTTFGSVFSIAKGGNGGNAAGSVGGLAGANGTQELPILGASGGGGGGGGCSSVGAGGNGAPGFLLVEW